jgi:hypothetical protein
VGKVSYFPAGLIGDSFVILDPSHQPFCHFHQKMMKFQLLIEHFVMRSVGSI